MAGGVGTIKLFKFTQKTYEVIGAPLPKSNQNRSCIINSKKCFYLLSLAQFFISSAAYLLFEANSMIEYGMVFFTCLTVIVALIQYLIFLWEMKNILNFIKNCERFAAKSEYTAKRPQQFSQTR